MSDKINSIEATYRALKKEGRKIVRLFSGNPNEHGITFPPEILKKLYSRHFDAGKYSPDPKGFYGARKAIAGYYASRGAFFDPENIILTSGTSESFFYLFSLLCKPGDNVLTPNPAYPLFDYIARLAHVELRHYSLDEGDGWAIDVDDIGQKIDSKTRAVVIISPNNPTGAVASEEEIRAVADLANKKGLAVISDEVFSEFIFENPGTDHKRGLSPQFGDCPRENPETDSSRFPRVASLAKPRLLFTLNGISKMFALPAMKLGWIAVSGEAGLVSDVVDGLETTADTFLSVHTAIQEALPEIFREGDGFLKTYREEVASRRALALEILQSSDRISVVPPRGGFYMMPRIRGIRGTRTYFRNRYVSPESEEDLVIRLMKEAGVFVHPGYFYDCEDEIHFVISHLTAPDVLEEGLKRLVNWLNFTPCCLRPRIISRPSGNFTRKQES